MHLRGPSCDDVCESVGLLASRWHLPVISFGCWSDILSNRDEFATLLRTTGSFGEIGTFVRNIMKFFSWKRVTLVTGPQAAWLSAVVNISIDFRNVGIVARRLTLDNDKLNETLFVEAQQCRIFVLCAYGQDIIHFMLTAYELGLMNGDYAFVAIDYANMAKIFPETYNSIVPLEDVFGGMLDITVDVRPEEPEFAEFMKDMDTFKATNNTSYEFGIRVALVVDAIYLYILALNNCIRDGGLCPLGRDIVNYLYGSTETGVTGSLAVDYDGSRHTSYMLHSIHGDRYVPVARTKDGGVGFQIIEGTTDIVWPGGSTKIPLGEPSFTLTVIGSVLALLIVAVLLGFLIYWVWSQT
ncbi:atrial natriuretic peptide receptor 3-like [Gigantopelta aegis]|uniref:atrial natriuretic peptide receptor 3-like n=1 Tax=Gigantopelta aegis TaxID=1735272 RepID=UPI001B888C87|nr:atrial natriuretic peptide receptor 3-like [Gigantopelta aegis]